jgi:hypothetical protein
MDNKQTKKTKEKREEGKKSLFPFSYVTEFENIGEGS